MYYPWGLQSAAIRFKNSLQENSKIHVITEDVIEYFDENILRIYFQNLNETLLTQIKDFL